MAEQRESREDERTTADTPEDGGVYRLRLYVAGQTPKSKAAIGNLRRICEEHLDHAYEIEVIDLLETPHLARADQILAIPTLVRRLPAPLKKVIGDLSRTEQVMVSLDLQKEAS